MSTKSIFIYLIVVILLIAVLTFFGSNQVSQTTASLNDPSRPQAMLEVDQFDFGDMTNDDIKEHEFTITNNGEQDLILTKVSTSCDCTYAYIIKDQQSSPKFTMHGTSNWSINLKKGEQVIVKVVYEPAIMPTQGRVSRVVSVATNDPANPTISFTVNANVTI